VGKKADIESEISRGIVGIYAQLYGRGPVHAQTYLHDRYVLSVLGEAFTTAEKTLLGAGRIDQVEGTRRAFQEAVREEFVEVVENAAGKSVAAFMSQIDAPTETAIELFLFESADGNGMEIASRDGSVE